MRRESLSVAEAAEALGTSPQTVRALLRKGELAGQRREWGARYVWEVSGEGLDAFLASNGRLDGRRRVSRPATVAEPSPIAGFFTSTAPDRRPFVLRPRGRATVVVILLGVPLLALHTLVRILPDALWFHEVDQDDVYTGTVAAKFLVYLLAAALAAVFVSVNLAGALLRTKVVRTRAGVLSLVAASLVVGSLLAGSAPQHWQTFMLWRHQQSFGSTDPIYGKDIGFFVFSLPFHLLVSGFLMWLVTVTAILVVVVNVVRGTLRVRPLRATFGATCHVAALASVFLLVVAWRLRLEQFRLELGQPSAGDRDAFAGAGYVDINVRSPGLSVLLIMTLILAGACLTAPFVARSGRTRRAVAVVAVPGVAVAVVALLAGAVVPAVVQRFVVEPNPLLSEGPFVAQSITDTRAGLGLDAIDVEPYRPTGNFSVSDFASIREGTSTVSVWDAWVLEARMQDLVSDTPYYRPGATALDVIKVDGRPQPTVVSARQLDLQLVDSADTWNNSRLAYTHGLGLVRFSGTDIASTRAPRLLDSGLGLAEPRIYFGDFPSDASASLASDHAAILGPTTDPRLADSPWVLANTRRAEVDVPLSEGAAADGPAGTAYHYPGEGGIELSSRVRRAAFALALASPEILLSDDITPESRLLLHRDVHDRLGALAPFIHWDSEAVPLTSNGRIVFVVEGYTTSQHYPYAEQLDLDGSPVNYARAPVRATVDAFSGETTLFLTDEAEPIARAWNEVFPNLFRPEADLPSDLRDRLRYPADLFELQATAYARYHAVRPDQFVSAADAWSRPIALSGPIEVAGDVDFDEDDEDDLRFRLEPAYLYARPPGEDDRSLLLRTYFTPRRGHNLVAALNGWIDENGDTRLASLSVPRDPVVLGPAQMSRLTFATKRVSNLLGLRNLEIRDLAKSSLDTVLLGRPRVVFLEGGPVQIQSLYEGSKGPGAARLIGVTAFLDGRVGLGRDIEAAVRQALNEPPSVQLLRPREPVVVGEPLELAFRVENAKRQDFTIVSEAGRQRVRSDITAGRGTIEWVPTAPGDVTVRVGVTGLDATQVRDRATFSVLGRPPRIRLISTPNRVEVGRPVRVSFQVANGRTAWAKVSSRSGIVFTRDYILGRRPTLVIWTPRAAGRAILHLRARGDQGQIVETRLRLTVRPRAPETPPPTVELLRVPETLTVGLQSRFEFRADGCTTAIAQIQKLAGDDEAQEWEVACPAQRASLSWKPRQPGRYLLTVTAGGRGTASNITTQLTVEDR